MAHMCTIVPVGVIFLGNFKSLLPEQIQPMQ